MTLVNIGRVHTSGRIIEKLRIITMEDRMRRSGFVGIRLYDNHIFGRKPKTFFVRLKLSILRSGEDFAGLHLGYYT